MDTNCKQAELWISIRVDRERLGEDDGRRLDEHLEVCVHCRGLLAVESRRTNLLHSVIAEPGADSRLTSSVLAALRREGSTVVSLRRRSWNALGRGRWTFAAAALLLIAFGAWQGVQPPPDPFLGNDDPRGSRQPPLADPVIIILERQEDRPDWSPDGRPRIRQDLRRDVITVPGESGPGGLRLRMESQEGRVRFVGFDSGPHY